MKKILLIILLMLPFFIYAEEECNKEKHKEYVVLSENITYENNYSKSSNTFTITIYNIFDGMYAKYNEAKYKPKSDNTIIVEKIAGGENVSIDIYGNDNCSPIRRIIVTEPYYNRFYGSAKCNGYENKLVMCSSQFTSTQVTESLLDKAIYNYNHTISQKTSKEKPVQENESFMAKLMHFLTQWGIKIVLAVFSTIISISLFSDKLRKVKHGI